MPEGRRARSEEPHPPDGPDLFRLMVESARDYAIFALDPTGHVLTWNAGAERFKGYTEREIVGRHFSIFYPPEDIAARKPERELEAAVRDGRVEDEGWRLHKNGTRFWADVVITAIRDGEGRLVGFGKVTRDLTERRRAEEALHESEERFRLLVETVRDYGIFMLDERGRVASWNEGARQISGWTEAEVLGRHFSMFYTAADLSAGKPEMELRVAKAEGRFEEEGWRLRKDGTPFWSSVTITAMRNPQGELVGFAKVTRDLTERRAAEERALADARRLGEAETVSRAKSEFLAALSHELRTPLNAIGGYADLLALGIRGPVNELQIEDLHRIQRSQQHLLGIINDLLNFSRIESGRVAYEIRPVRLADVLRAVRSMVEMQAEAKELDIAWPRVRRSVLAIADARKVEQILLNVLTNAIRYTDPGGRIEVAQATRGGKVALIVRDTGVGIAADKLAEIFEPFVQVGRSLTSTHEGTGLGLAISRDLARAMGGDLTVRSTLGAGSEFTLELPRHTGAPDRGPQQGAPSPDTRSGQP